MKVFLSWSGDHSRDVANALRDWLPLVINEVEPFVSDRDIYAGARWQAEVARQLEATDFGVICVTASNQREPWLNFEAGALAKAVDQSRVVPLAVNLRPSDIELPLGQFQAKKLDEEGVYEMLESMNASAERPLGDVVLQRSVQKWWPDLALHVDEVADRYSAPSAAAAPGRSDRDLLEEVLDTIRGLAAPANLARAPGPLPSLLPNHPIHRELGDLLDEARVPYQKIERHSNRRAVRVWTTESVPDHVRERAEVIALPYAIEVVWYVRVPNADE